MPRNSYSTLIEAFQTAPALVRGVMMDMNESQLKARPIAGKWSTLEVLAHLVDSDQAWCHRVKRAIAEDRPLLIGYDETRFTAALGYQDRLLDEELALFVGMRDQMARVLRGLDDAAFSRVGVHSERGLVTVEEMIRLETEHVHHHVRHILEKRHALGLPESLI